MNDTIDFTPIKDGEYGAINFNNMIPVIDGVYELIDLEHKPSLKEEIIYQDLLKNQIEWLNDNKSKIFRKPRILYHLYNTNQLYDNVKNRCCNF